MMIPPQTILDMHKFMHDELHGKREASQRREPAAQTSEHRLGRIARTLCRRQRRELVSNRESDQFKTATI